MTPVNDAPTDVTLAGATTMEAAAAGTLVGTLAGIDVDGVAGHAFTLIDDAGGRFALAGNQLVVKNGVQLDYEQAGTHLVTVRLTDGAFVLDKVLSISVSNIESRIRRGYDSRGDVRAVAATSAMTVSTAAAATTS